MNHNQRAALANPNLEFGASTFLGIPVGPKQALLVYKGYDPGDGFLFKELYEQPDGSDLMFTGIGNNRLIEVVLPANMGTLKQKNAALESCGNLIAVHRLNDMEEIPYAFLSECISFDPKIITVKRLGERAFYGCTGITKLELPYVEVVGKWAFWDATNATIVLNDNVQTVNEEAFLNIDNLIYHGSLPGAPWGAKKWNGVPQN